MQCKILVTWLTCCMFAQMGFAAPGEVDLTFDPGSGINWDVYSAAVQTNGKVVIGGAFNVVRGAMRNGIARLNTDGTADTTFDPGAGADGPVFAVALQTDGKILVGGAFSTINGTNRNCIARLNTDGSLDTAFNPSLWVDSIVRSIVVQPDGKILMGGDGVWGVVRLKADGNYDNSFQLLFSDDLSWVASLALQSDGRIVVGGNFTSIRGTNWNHVARLNTNGTPDTAFNPGSGPNSVVNSVAIQTGKLLIGGWFTSVNGTNRNYIARLNADGSPDNTFNPGTGANSGIESVAVQTDDSVLLGGSFSSVNGNPRRNVARLNPNGSLDFTFNPSDGVNTNVHAVVLQTNGKVLVGGQFSPLWGPTNLKALARLNGDGTLDTTFNADNSVNAGIEAVAVQPDGKVLIGGDFTFINGTNRNGVARLNANGSLDGTFDPGSGAVGADPLVRSVVLQPDGKVLIGGWFTNFNGTSRSYLARLNTDGSLDPAFDPFWDPTWGPNGPVYGIAVQTNGQVLSVDGGIRRRGTNGIVDSTFTPTIAGGLIVCVAVQPDQKILIAGWFTTVNAINHRTIARLNSDGSPDGTFNAGTGAGSSGSIFCMALQPEGKVLVGGDFNSINGQPRSHIARLNANGSLDGTFDPGTGADLVGYVYSLAVQPDGKVLLGGDFSSINGIARNRVARLNANGSVDATFDPGTGPNGGRVNSLAVQGNGGILAGGGFRAFGGIARNSLVRLLNAPVLTIERAGNSVVLRWLSGPFTLQTSPGVTGTFTNVPGATSPYTNPITGPQRYFRLGPN